MLVVTDDGKAISVYVKGPAVHPKYEEVPVLQIAIPDDSQHHHIAFFNRELLAEAVHESHIDNVIVTKLVSKD
jgi:hypothetical protein